MNVASVPHEHVWKTPDGPFIVIDTWPEQYPYVCECGAFTHDPPTGTPCQMCAPDDYARRGPTVLLHGGPFDGRRITRPGNQSVYLRCEDEGRVQKIVKYEANATDEVWEFAGNNWTHPFEERHAD